MRTTVSCINEALMKRLTCELLFSFRSGKSLKCMYALIPSSIFFNCLITQDIQAFESNCIYASYCFVQYLHYRNHIIVTSSSHPLQWALPDSWVARRRRGRRDTRRPLRRTRRLRRSGESAAFACSRNKRPGRSRTPGNRYDHFMNMGYLYWPYAEFYL